MRVQVDIDEDLDGGTTTRVVVAAIDSGVNPYHEFFHHGGNGPYASNAPAAVTPAVLAEFGIGPEQIIEVRRTGNMAADLAADEDTWARVERGTPYWFKGTNVIGVSFQPNQPPLKPVAGKRPHGVGVVAAVLEANPDAVVVLIESRVSIPMDEFSEQRDAEAWAHTHPAIDIITTSYGAPGSPPIPAHLSSSYTGVVRNGKLHFAALDNSPALSPLDSSGGPWWSIGVAGWQEEGSRGRDVRSGMLPDFVANSTQTLPNCMDCQSGRDNVVGTSLAAPRSAGTTSAILLEARRQAGHKGGIVTSGVAQPLMVDGGGLLITNWRFRRALEVGAFYPRFEDYQLDPFTTPNDADVTSLLSPSAPFPDPVAAGEPFAPAQRLGGPWLVGGWGAITPDPKHEVMAAALRDLGIGSGPPRFKPPEACAFMTAQIEARYAYWNHVALLGESWLQTDDPYLRC